MKGDKTHYRRNLPHIQPENGVFNICFRLAGSLPKEVIINLQRIQNLKKEELQKSVSTTEELHQALRNERDLYFGKFDALLDNPSCGPTFLHNRDVAKIVEEAIMYRYNSGQYKLVCYSIMPNHVHLILYKIQQSLFRILQSLKSNTATKANILLDRVGEQFWHSESYDNLIHSREELSRKIQYILNNPVKSGLCQHWEDWSFSYLNPEFLVYAPQ